MITENADLIKLLAGIGAILVVASFVGQILKRRAGPDGSAVIDNLNARTNAWWAMVILMAIAFLGGRAGVILLFGFCSFAALREFATLTNTKRGDHLAIAGAFFVVLPIQYYAIWIDWYGFFSIFSNDNLYLAPLLLQGFFDYYLIHLVVFYNQHSKR